MAGSNKEKVFGSKLEYSIDTGTTWVKIKNAKVAAVPEEAPDYEEVTNLDSVGGVKEYVETLIDPGEVDFECDYTDDGFVALSALKGTLLDLKSTFTGGATVEYKGFLRVAMNNDDHAATRKMTVKIKCSGASTFTAGV